MDYWKFICSWETESECYIRRLFGNGGDTVEKTEEKLDVKEGDTLFLHRWRSSGGFLDGPFIAASDAQDNIVPHAWDHGEDNRFWWQVEVEWEDRVYSLQINDLNSEDTNIIEIENHPQVFNEVQGTWLCGRLQRKGTPIISPP